MSLAEAGEEEIVAARRAFEADLEKSPAPQENGGAATPQQQSEGYDGPRNLDEEDDVREGETEEKALQRRIEEGKIGKGKTLRRWKDTEEKQRRVETGRHASKIQRYGRIYEEVKALRKETRHSVQDLRERYKDKGVIQNKDQFIVKLIAQERNEQEGKVAAIKSLQQWRLTDVELHNFINRCHKKGIAGKLELAMQWAIEQGEAGGEVNFKEGLAFYSSIGILQPRSSAHTQQQWREWREWEDALTYALEKHKTRDRDVKGADAAGPEGSCSNEDSTVCNSPWSSERGGGGGSFAGFSGGSLRASSAHGEGSDGRHRCRSGTAPENGTGPEQASKDALLLAGRGRTPPHGKSRDGSGSNREWSWRSYSPPPSTLLRVGRGSTEVAAAAAAAAAADGGTASNGKPPPSPGGVFDASDRAADSGKLSDAVRSSGGYLPPRHRLTTLQLSPASHTGAARSESGEPCEGAAEADVGGDRSTEGERDSTGEAVCSEGAETEEAPTLDPAPDRSDLESRGAVSTAAKGRRASTPSKSRKVVKEAEGPAPTEEDGGGGKAKRGKGLLSEFADWLMPGMENRRSTFVKTELIMDVYPTENGGAAPPQSPDEQRRRPAATRSAPATPRGRKRQLAVLRDGGWFYNGDSDYSTEDEMELNYETEDEGFWADAGTAEPEPVKAAERDGNSILSRLKKLFTLT